LGRRSSRSLGRCGRVRGSRRRAGRRRRSSPRPDAGWVSRPRRRHLAERRQAARPRRGRPAPRLPAADGSSARRRPHDRPVLPPRRGALSGTGGPPPAGRGGRAPRSRPPAANVRMATEGPPDRAVLAALEGTWLVKSATLEGHAVPDKKISEATWAFHGGKL